MSVKRYLEDFGPIGLGFKTLLNDFFYVTQETIDRFGIEPEFLSPVYRLRHLDADRYFQSGLTPSNWLFDCHKELKDLAGTGALLYIRWGEKQVTRPRKQSEAPVPWPKAPALNHSKTWYQPAAIAHKARIGLRKAPGQRFSPYLFENDVLLDQRLYWMQDGPKTNWDLLAAYLSSSLFPLSLETNANLSLGVGYLTFGTKSLRRLPTVDLHAIKKDEAKAIIAAAKVLWSGPAMDVSEFGTSDAQRDLDGAFLIAAGLPESRVSELHDQVAHFAEVRKSLQELKDRALVTSTTVNLSAVATEASEALGQWLAARRFPEDFCVTTAERLSFGSTELGVTTEAILTQCSVEVTCSGGTLLKQEYEVATAEVLLRALQLGRREFSLPASEDEADRALIALAVLLVDFNARFQVAMAEASVGSKYEDRIRRKALAMLGVELDDLNTTFDTQQAWNLPAS